ncbi:hypothetical protein [Halomonas stenophila]|uniref:Thioesterase domain-containing protein n=1 Tax=Halomonas stenophila TaxID=795312 RepID=A0A7W5HMX7_9GAMM|nr:hypothetical protein [Halomonas stenophila]
MPWDLPAPCLIAIDVEAAAIDAFGHANNAEYLRVTSSTTCSRPSRRAGCSWLPGSSTAMAA